MSHSWSDDLKEYTRASLSWANDFVPMMNFICMKHIDGKYGYITLADYANKRSYVHIRDSDVVECFDFVDYLIDAGWVMD